MLILKVVGVGLTAVVLLVMLRRERPEMAVQLSLAAATIILLFLLPQLTTVMRLLETLSLRAHIQLAYLDSVLRIIGIAYLAEFGAQVARDAGEGALAMKIELGGKLLILLVAIPIVSAILQLVLHLLQA